MVHGIAIEGGRALWYCNRWTGSHSAAAALGREAAPGPRHGRMGAVNTTWWRWPVARSLTEAESFPVELSSLLDNQRKFLRRGIFYRSLVATYLMAVRDSARQESLASTSAVSGRRTATCTPCPCRPTWIATDRRHLPHKHDLQTGTRQVHEFGEGHLPGGFVFVPASPEAEEDEGWLMGLSIDVSANTTDLAILDAQCFQAVPVATVHLPHRIPPGFNGNWLPNA